MEWSFQEYVASLGEFRLFEYDAQLAMTALSCQAYKHIFTSPSSVEKEPRATRSGNARIRGMIKVTPASIAYIATRVWHCNHQLLCYCSCSQSAF